MLNRETVQFEEMVLKVIAVGLKVNKANNMKDLLSTVLDQYKMEHEKIAHHEAPRVR